MLKQIVCPGCGKIHTIEVEGDVDLLRTISQLRGRIGQLESPAWSGDLELVVSGVEGIFNLAQSILDDLASLNAKISSILNKG